MLDEAYKIITKNIERKGKSLEVRDCTFSIFSDAYIKACEREKRRLSRDLSQSEIEILCFSLLETSQQAFISQAESQIQKREQDIYIRFEQIFPRKDSFWMNVWASLVSTIIFTGILVILYFSIVNDISFINLIREQQIELEDSSKIDEVSISQGNIPDVNIIPLTDNNSSP